MKPRSPSPASPQDARSDNVAALVKDYGIGLTGGIATGKSTVARLLMERGETVIDADALSRSITAPGTPGLAAVARAFGSAIIAPDGSLDRKALGSIVFQGTDRSARSRLEAITHPLIREALIEELKTRGLLAAPRRFFYEAALLFEAGRDAEFAEVWATTCSRDMQLARLMARDGLDRERAEAVLASQLPAAEKAARATRSISTDGDLASVAAAVDHALAALRGR